VADRTSDREPRSAVEDRLGRLGQRGVPGDGGRLTLLAAHGGSLAATGGGDDRGRGDLDRGLAARERRRLVDRDSGEDRRREP
jgi:hypothetical protein